MFLSDEAYLNNKSVLNQEDIADINDNIDTTSEAIYRLSRRSGYRFVKRTFDIVFSSLIVILFSWLYLLIALFIKLDDPHSPVFFKQQRVGKDGNEFFIYKFRTMYPDAEERLKELQSTNEKDGPVFKMKNDPRVTKVGHFLRKTSLDEIPQLFNVILDDMSLVGPRPALASEVVQYTPYQMQRLMIKPGCTCFWQTRINRDSLSFDEWVDLDLLYIRECSVWTDIKLIIQTVGVMLTAQGE